MSWSTFLKAATQKDGLSDIVIREDGLTRAYVNNHYIELERPGEEHTFDHLIKMIYGERKPSVGLRADEPSVVLDGLRFRASYALCHAGREIVLRYVKEDVLSPQELLIPEQVVEQTLRLRSGLVLLAGEMGSGKSTTMNALIRAYAEAHSEHIETVEDPIEVVHKTIKGGSSFTQREVGRSCESYAQGLKEARRRRAKVIVLGEIRDAETAEECLRAAMMGTVIFTTIHGGDAPEAIRAFLQELSDGRATWGQKSLAACLRIVVAQRLVRHKSQVVPIHEVLFNLDEDPHHDLAVASHVRSGELERLRQDIESNRGPQAPYYMQRYPDSILLRVTENRLPRSFLRS